MAKWKHKVDAANALVSAAERERDGFMLQAASAKGDAQAARQLALDSIDLVRRLVTATEPRMSPGVYFLLNKMGRVVYVGQSENVLARMAGHVTKDFHTARMIELARQDDRNEIELRLIQLLTPPLNVQGLRFNRPMDVLRGRVSASGGGPSEGGTPK